jgi:flagellar protein FliO/FliZ
MDSTIGAALSGLLGTIIALAVVLGLAWVSLRALRRWQDRGLGGRRDGRTPDPLRPRAPGRPA